VVAVRIERAQLFKYTLPLTKPLAVRSGAGSTREGFLLKLEGGEDSIGWGEIAPLSGISKETVNDSVGELARTIDRLDGCLVPNHLEELSGGFESWLVGWKLNASVRCGLEMAVLNLTAATSDRTLAHLLADKHASAVKVNGLTSGTDAEIVEACDRLQTDGFQTVKIKVGGRSVEQDVELVKQISSRLGGQLMLRLDANQYWSLDEACEFADGIKSCSVEYIEEPLQDASQLSTLSHRTGLAIAQDESLIGLDPAEWQPPIGLSAIVLKPTLLGGFEKSMMFARHAVRHNKVRSGWARFFIWPHL
jgi:o-succinylbenzoate synthase